MMKVEIVFYVVSRDIGSCNGCSSVSEAAYGMSEVTYRNVIFDAEEVNPKRSTQTGQPEEHSCSNYLNYYDMLLI